MALLMSPTRSRTLLRQETQQQEQILKSRRRVERYLHRMRVPLGRNLSLNQEGLCYFTHGRFVVVIEVSSTDPSTLILDSCVYQFSEDFDLRSPNSSRTLETSVAAIQLTDELRMHGANVDVFENEVHFQNSVPIERGLSFKKFHDIVLSYLSSLPNMSQQVERAVATTTQPR